MALKGHVIRTIKVANEGNCMAECYAAEECVSYNFSKIKEGFHLCELSRSDGFLHPMDLKRERGILFRAVKNPCNKRPCKGKDSKCLTGFTGKGYKCQCSRGFRGDLCDEEIKYTVAAPAQNCATCCQLMNMTCAEVGAFPGGTAAEIYKELGLTCDEYTPYKYEDQPCYNFNTKRCMGAHNIPHKINCAKGDNKNVKRVCPCVQIDA